MRFLFFLGALALATATVLFEETFPEKKLDGWVESSNNKGKTEAGLGLFYGDADASVGLKTTENARFYAVGKSFPKFSSVGKTLVVQFSVQHSQNIDCGGGYVKLLPSSVDLASADGDSQYNIMFGPDICGSTKRCHVIFNHGGENHLVSPDITITNDQKTHLYTLIVTPETLQYEVLIDNVSKRKGSLEDDFKMVEPKKIKDPALSKPSDWVDEKEIDDPEDVKPEGYDDIPKEINDPEAEKPDDWDDDADGDWEAPTLPNPEYKGPWKAKRIPNPEYKGEWVHPEIDNPDFKADPQLGQYEDFGSLFVDVWQVKSGSVFDNFLVTDSVEEARQHAEKHFTKYVSAENDMKEAEDKKQAEEAAKRAEEEAARRKAEEEEDEDEDEDDEDDDEEERDEL
jgi:calreticulin